MESYEKSRPGLSGVRMGEGGARNSVGQKPEVRDYSSRRGLIRSVSRNVIEWRWKHEGKVIDLRAKLNHRKEKYSQEGVFICCSPHRALEFSIR